MNHPLKMAIPNDLPTELLSKILTFLPPKTLLRFTSASKSWYNLITNPVFITSQISATTQNPNLPLFLSEGRDQHSIWRDGQDFADRTLLKCPWKKQNPLICYAANSCNGLVCMFTCNKEIFLWNPSIRKYMKLDPAPVEGFDSLSISVGLGFDSANNDYKVVAITYYENWPSKIIVPAPSSYAQIYSVNTGAWRNIRYPYRDRGTNCLRSQVFFNGVIHWLIGRMSEFAEDNEDDLCILTFNLKSEVFGVLKLPSCIRDISNPNVSLGVVKDSIALYFQRFGEGCRIFLMKDYGVHESWACFYNIKLPEEHVTVFCLRNPHELLVSRGVLGFLYCYAPQELHSLHSHISKLVRPFPCLESLVLLDKWSKPSWCKLCKQQGRLALLKGS